MMELRPIVTDADGTILGGNMRFEALQRNGVTEVPDEWIKSAETLTDDERRRFIIEDNVGFGEWDFDILYEWDKAQLSDWGVGDDVLELFAGDEVASFDIDTDKRTDTRQMTFIVTEAQYEKISAAVEKARPDMPQESANVNSNGNAISYICEDYVKS